MYNVENGLNRRLRWSSSKRTLILEVQDETTRENSRQ